MVMSLCSGVTPGLDLGDPVATANAIVDKKARNLEKRRVRGIIFCTYILSLSLSLFHTHSHFHSLSLSLTHSLSLSLSLTHSLSLSLSHSLSLSLSLTLSLPLSPQNKLMALKQSIETGVKLTKDQEEAVMKLDEVNIQLDLVRELQKQFMGVTTEVKKCENVMLFSWFLCGGGVRVP